MRLICGALHLDGTAASQDLLLAMAAQMDVPRLRPGLKLWHDGSIGLAVLDFSAHGAAASPLPNTASWIMAADVRLDESVALARMLDGDTAQADDVLLLAAFERFGPSGLDRVLGDFAFASWDMKAKRLVCARDLFGVRPFYYVHLPDKLFAFASFPSALYGAGIVAKVIDEAAVVRRMVRVLRHDDSLIASVRRLPPAHVLEVSRRGISLKRYWQLDRAAIGARQWTLEEAALEMRRLVDEAVRCRMPYMGEIGAHLSGGLDSSAIAVLAARQLRRQGRRLHAYSMLDRQRNDITLEDESKFVQAVLEQEDDIDWTPIRPPSRLTLLDKTTDAGTMRHVGADEPATAVCARAEAQRVVLVLSGWGGDEGASFNGRGALAELLLCGRWRTLAREVSALSRRRGWPRLRTFRGEVLSYVWKALLPGSALDLMKRVMGERPAGNKFRYLLSAAARQRLADCPDAALEMAASGRENRRRLLTSPHVTECAEALAQIGARHGLAFAFPLLDRRVVEFALSLPSELFLRDGFRRRLFRDAMTDVLPPAVRLRHQKLAPFPSRLIDIVEHKNELLAKIGAYEENKRVRRIIDLASLRRLIEAFPSAEQVREEMRGGDNPAAALMIAAAAHAISAAGYLDHHGSDDGLGQIADTVRAN